MPQAMREWTVADVDALPDDGNRYEVIDGQLLVTPSPAWKHQEAVAQLYLRMAPYLAAQRAGHALFAPADVIFSPRRLVQPDLFVVPLVDGRRPEQYEAVKHLLLAVEVLSPSTARADRVQKRGLYHEEGVDEYWIVDLDAQVIERSTPTDTRSDIHSDRIEWRPAAARESLVLDLGAYFADVLGTSVPRG